MNSCKHCGKEIPEGRKFCNSSCAAKYNNKHRQPRKPWTEEQHEKRSKRLRLLNDQKRVQNGKDFWYDQEGNVLCKEHRCSYCGKILQKNERTVCTECRTYRKYQSLPERLGFSDGTPRERYEAAIEYLKGLYLSGESTLTLSKRFGIPDETIWYNLKKAGLTRNLSESFRVAELAGRRVDSGVNPMFKHGWHTSWEGFEGYYRSSYELAYARELDEKKISYRIEYIPAFTIYFDTQKNIRRVAKPDFYLPDTNEIVEIKSWFTYDEQNMKDRFKAYQERGFVPRLILEGKPLEACDNW